jgi:hypothetical protein
MAKPRKTPQEKKELEYAKDHFTFGSFSSRMFPRTWKRKRASANRQYRRKGQELLAPAKTGVTLDDIEILGDDLTAKRFQKSVRRKPLRKHSTVSVGEKIKKKLERRNETINRRAVKRRHYDLVAASAVKTLCSLQGTQMTQAARQMDRICSQKDANELSSILRSPSPLSQALHFLYLVAAGSFFEIEALRRNPDLDKALATWLTRANKILRRDKRTLERSAKS